jgi:single-strand DNA-binding protein
MGSLNKVMLIGNLGRDPELRSTPGGTQVANFSLATTENFTDRSGNRQERTEWHRVVLWGKLAEIASQYLSKGRQVYIEGRLQTREWEDKQGQKRQTTEVVGTTMVMLGGRGEGRGPTHDEGEPRQYQPAEAGNNQARGGTGGFAAPSEDPSMEPIQEDDDLPF